MIDVKAARERNGMGDTSHELGRDGCQEHREKRCWVSILQKDSLLLEDVHERQLNNSGQTTSIEEHIEKKDIQSTLPSKKSNQTSCADRRLDGIVHRPNTEQ